MIRLRATISLFALTAASMIVAPAWAQQAPSEAEGEPGEIVVTGTKRGDSVQDTVQSVTVISADDMRGLLQTFDAFTRVPNITANREA